MNEHFTSFLVTRAVYSVHTLGLSNGRLRNTLSWNSFYFYFIFPLFLGKDLLIYYILIWKDLLIYYILIWKDLLIYDL